MLTEHFIASVGVFHKSPGSSDGKDASIVIHEYQPLKAQKAVFKKSTTRARCLAVNESHVFAAQADKAVVHVYNREKGNQEATVPFTERITCITLACEGTILILGTVEGRIFLWEIASGRQVTTAQSHLQSVTAIAVDPTSNFLLSASADSTIHVWSLPSLLSFSHAGADSTSPLRTFASHKSKITALALGHSFTFSNFAVSTSTDKTCLIWDYHTNTVLRTYLLPAIPTILALDAADRAIYVGCEDGGVQLLDLFATSRTGEPALNDTRNSSDSLTPIQPPKSTKWTSPENSFGKVHCLDVSFDGNTILSGHESGDILAWDVARNGSPTTLLRHSLPGPVTNLIMLPVTGFVNESHPHYRVQSVVKPKFAAFDNSSGHVPGNYALSIETLSNDLDGQRSEFESALASPAFTSTLNTADVNEVLSWGTTNYDTSDVELEGDDDFMPLDGVGEKPQELSLQEQNAFLRAEINALHELQKASFSKIDRIDAERKTLMRREQARRVARQGPLPDSRHFNGNHSFDNEMDESSGED